MTAPMPHPNLSANGLLAAMPSATLALLDKWSHEVLAQGHTCLSAGEPIRSVYFPISGMISLVISTETGDLIEAGMVGSEGVAGLQSVFGPRTAFTSAVVQILLGEMLGIRRTSMTLLAQELQARGIIRYSRGKIVIINRIALEACACECYRTTKELYREVSGHAQKQSAARAS